MIRIIPEYQAIPDYEDHFELSNGKKIQDHF